MVDYLRRLFGYAVSGSVREHAFVVFHGTGRNGKGVLVEALQRVLGPLASPIPPEMLLDQGRVRNSAGPSPDIKSLQGLRLAFAAETDQGRRFSAGAVKRLSGGDSISARNPHDRAQSTFQPSHLLILATNFRPKANADDPAFWARMHLVDFPLSFVERPAAPNERPVDRTLEEKLLAEGPGILAWLVRGCLEWQQIGLRPPKKILEATAQYRRSEDDLADWLEEKCIEAEGATVTAKAAYASFKEWFAATISDKVPSQKRWGEMMSRRFQKEKGGTDNTVRYLGLELRSNFG
jgi:putative DNA primase/helicase